MVPAGRAETDAGLPIFAEPGLLAPHCAETRGAALSLLYACVNVHYCGYYMAYRGGGGLAMSVDMTPEQGIWVVAEAKKLEDPLPQSARSYERLVAVNIWTRLGHSDGSHVPVR